MRTIGRSPVALWSAFMVVHLWIGLLNLYGPGLPLGDVSIVYKFWSDQVFLAGFWVGIDSSWVYPVLAIFPMLAAGALGPGLYVSTWLSLMMILDAVAFASIIGWRRTTRRDGVRVVAAWSWLGFLLLLGPIALGRIDTVTIALGIVGVMFAATRPRLAALILSIAAWVKVWPAAIVAAMVVALGDRLRVLGTAVLVSMLVIAGALSFGSGANVLSFVTQQTGRGLQVEAPVSTIWLWQAFAGVPGTYLYYDQHILTWQVTGDGVGIVGAFMTPLMALAVAAIVLVAVLAVRRGAEPPMVLATLSLALVAALIVFNKVGSPQFIGWLAVPLVLGLVTRHPEDRWWFVVPAVVSAVVAVMTQAIYPYLYGWLLGLHPVMLAALTARNALVVVLLGWAVHALWAMARPETVD
ncbi:MAG TPA: glycosyltransferase 87 family protein [Terrimesophilobacter sp.]|nr:glycosyltransferase 87 family protein [Terrimesophilobacter sp.]